MNMNLPGGPAPALRLVDKIRMGMAFNRDVLAKVWADFMVHGPLFRYQIGEDYFYLAAHPDDIHQILVTDAEFYHKDMGYTDPKRGLAMFLGNGLLTSDGAFWKRQRKLMQPLFHTKRIEAYAEQMVELSRKTRDGWRDGEVIQVDEAMMHLTLDIVAGTIFHADLSTDAPRIGSAMDALQYVGESLPLIPEWLPTPAKIRAQQALKTLDEIVYRMIAEQRQRGTEGGDLLSMLLAARDEDGQGMSDQQVRDEAVTLILAGHETTANAMNWTFYLLAQHPEIEAKLHEELDRVLGGRLPTLDDLKQLTYTEKVIKESMRLLPPVPGISRIATKDLKLRDFDVPKGTVVNIFTYVTHRHPDWWENPDVFDPERFTPEREKAIPRYAYLPFGGGPRVCMGVSFAMMEARLILATLAQQYRLSLVPGMPVKPDAKITLRPKPGLPMRVERRAVVTEGNKERELVV